MHPSLVGVNCERGVRERSIEGSNTAPDTVGVVTDLSQRRVFGILVVLTIPLGLLSRTSIPMPGFVRVYGGDILSATCIYFGVAFVAIRRSTVQRCLLAYLICVLLELQQLLRWTWLVRAREETPLDILLGHGFLWSDIVSYAFGVVLGAIVGSAVLRITDRSARQIA